MAHEHAVIDSEVYFTIDPKSKLITGETEEIVQYDHNSERITFKVPKTIEGHDMSQCDSIEIHYENVKGAESNLDRYKVEDFQADQSDSDLLRFSWLISRNATQLDGLVKFSIVFSCHDENGVEVYRFGTKKCSLISVSEGYDNTELVLELYPDAFSQIDTKVGELAKEVAKNSEASHIHQNANTLDGFYCRVDEEGKSENPEDDYLNYQGNLLRYTSQGAVISDVSVIEKDGQSFYRLMLDWGADMMDKSPFVIDIPIKTANNVEVESGDITLNGSELDFGMSSYVTTETFDSAITDIKGDINEIEALIDDSGVLK